MYKLTQSTIILRLSDKRHAARGMSLRDHFDLYFNTAPQTLDGCLEWAGSRDVNGYGRIQKEGKTYKAHRLAFEYLKGTFDQDLEICHSCDNPSCVNPEHLFAGTTKDNAEDRERKGRGNHYSKEKDFLFRNPAGDLVHVRNLTKFCSENALRQPKMSEVFYGTRKHHKGWTRHV